MIYVIISDVHSNMEAFNAVVEEISLLAEKKTAFLGDIVGYGPEPNESIELLRKVADFAIGGNHDWACVDLTDITYFNIYAQQAVLWTKSVLKPGNASYLKSLKPMGKWEGLTLAHGSPREPEAWHYLFSVEDAELNFSFFDTQVCFVGHSHYPINFIRSRDGRIRYNRNANIEISPGERYIINVGSIGQPRDGNPDSAFAIYDTESNLVQLKRVPYDIATTQEKMRVRGLPGYLINRLALGR